MAADIYVSRSGNDSNEGTKDKPLATMAGAFRKARELRRLNDPSVIGGIHIKIEGGTYTLYEPIFIRPEDSGSDNNPTIVEPATAEKVVFSGGARLDNWYRPRQKVAGLPANAQSKVWVTDVPDMGGKLFEFRQLWINNIKATRAKNCNGDSMSRILNWNKKEESCWIPLSKGGLQYTAGMEMFIHQWWAIAILRIRSVEVSGDSARLLFQQPESKIQSEHPWPAPWISKETGNSAFYLMNAIQFLDEPGEWYLDIANRKLYYWPRDNEDMRTAVAVVPHMETLVKMQGTLDDRVSNIQFNRINFQHTGWLRPSQYGHIPHQAGMYMLDAYKLKVPGTPDKKTLENQAWVGRPAAAVDVSYAESVKFENCRFEHMASTGFDFGKAVKASSIRGSLFKDIGGTAILAGVFSDENTEVHVPYDPKDERELTVNVDITYNVVTDAANEDWGCVGIGAGYVRNIVIARNDISNVSYTGISLGWGWTKTINAMRGNLVGGNRIHHYGKHNYDCAGIYTLSAQPGTLITKNYVDSIYKAPYAHLPNHWFYIYTDEGSAYMAVSDNWTPSEKFLQNANGENCVWMNNGPGVDAKIKQTAGLVEMYRELLNEVTPPDPGFTINKEEPAMIEIVANGELDIKKLNETLEKSKVPVNSVYRWQNHYVIFGKVQDVHSLAQRLRSAFPAAEVRPYNDLFYEFNRQRCDPGTTAKEWDHVILTANLVADPKMQQEYLNYHTTQWEKWPEIAKGFCNASFQQLLIYRNGRQLMLVISIPKGESLDKLNPRTTENNPRVDEWNKIMAKYQEGIAGTAKGETWVFLQNLP
jgi:L-rhamnose mutarotase